MANAPGNLENASHDDLRRLVEVLLEEVAELKRENAALREENARLKGQPPRPKLKPSGMAKGAASRGKGPAKGGKKRSRGSKRSRLTIDEDRVLAPAVPQGSRFKGYEDYLVQDLVVRPHTIRYRRERWVTPSGETVLGELPANTKGHFGPELRRLVLALYHRGQMTVGRLTRQLNDLGLVIDKRQVQRLLTDQEDLVTEARDVLLAGLETAPWVSVDDTGARHQARNGFCTQVGNDRFTAFVSSYSKSRLNFLEVLRAGYTDYVVNDVALAYMRERKLSLTVIEWLSAGPTHFADTGSWEVHLAELGLDRMHVHPNPVRIATEGALWGAIQYHGLLADTVILSDDARQFRVGEHALCWVHAERLVHKLDTFHDAGRAAVECIRKRLWWLYADLKAYKREPDPQRKAQLDRRFNNLFKTRTGFVTLDRLLGRLYDNKADLLKVLERPEVPLHTNGSENDIRCQVTRRKVSGGTRSDTGRESRDALLALMKTCDKLGVSFWHFLGDRLGVQEGETVPPLPDLIRAD